MLTKLLFLLGLALAASPWVSPPVALVLGLSFALIFRNPFPRQTRLLSRSLLQASVVGLGFGMDLAQVLRAGRAGFVYTALGIAAVLVAGVWLGRLLRVPPTNGLLITVGTAICGGSAIAAVGPVVGASDEEMSVSLGTVFILNSVALLLFPFLGAAAALTQTQFGLWAALAIHDTSSVVGAGVKYGGVALAVATTVKLARALWIVPVTLGAAALKRTRARIHWPWFILFFLLAAVLNTYLPAGARLFAALALLAKAGLQATLYLIGSNISRENLKTVGPRPLLLGVLLWTAVAALSLVLIRARVLSL